jgi:hypothetical protein
MNRRGFALDQRDREETARALDRRSATGYWRLHDLALANGFTEAQAPFAAVRAHILHGGGRRHISWNQVREGCKERYPEVFSE